MIPVGGLLFAAFSSLTAFGLWKFFQFAYQQLTSPIRQLPGPKGTNWIVGNMEEVWDTEMPEVVQEWVRQYGSTLKYKSLFYSNRMLTMDLRAVSHILSHSLDYQRSQFARYDISLVFGKGVIFSEGAHHHRERRILNPAFGPAEIRALTDIFHAKAVQLRDIMSSEISKDPSGTTTGTRLDFLRWMNRLTLDIITLAGFNRDINSLDSSERPNELSDAFSTVFSLGRVMNIIPMLQGYIPALRLIPTDRARELGALQNTMTTFGKQVLSGGKEEARTSVTENGEIKKNNFRGRDLLSVLMKANMATDIPTDQRLSDQEVLDQVATFLVTGHESTGVVLTWALYAMTNAPEVQTKLREELLLVDTETPSMDGLNALPYLDAVVRETLRMHPPVINTERIATKDDVIPIERPFTDKNGVVHNSVRVSKGDQIIIPVLAINRSPELWGPDAHDFKPERWQNVPEAVSHIPGVWGNQLTFIGGPRACIGWRFALVEMKAILFTLLRAFEFERGVPASEIKRMLAVVPVQRPVLINDPKNKAQLPLLVRPYRQE